MCCVWIAAIVIARANAGLATDDPSVAMSVSDTVVMGIAFVGLALLLAGALMPWQPPRGGGLVGSVVFSVVASGLVADGRVVAWDAAAAILTAVGALAILQARNRWMGIVPLGIACGLSPLCASALVVLLLPSAHGRRRAADALPVVAIGVAVAWVLHLTIGRLPGAAFAVGSDLNRIGPQNLWRFVAWWLDLGMPALVFACVAAALRFFGDAENIAATRSLAVWLGINVLVGVFLPRVVLCHGLLLLLPAFMLTSSGYLAMRRLPVNRSHWTLSLFSAVCLVLPFALLWTSLRKAGEIAVVSLGAL